MTAETLIIDGHETAMHYDAGTGNRVYYVADLPVGPTPIPAVASHGYDGHNLGFGYVQVDRFALMQRLSCPEYNNDGQYRVTSEYPRPLLGEPSGRDATITVSRVDDGSVVATIPVRLEIIAFRDWPARRNADAVARRNLSP